MDGRTVVVTGGNCGLGYFAAEQLAGLGATVVIAARDADRAARALRSVRAHVPDADVSHQPLDLASLTSVRAAADALGSLGRLDALLANAAAIGLPDHAKPRELRGPRPLRTTDGHELHWGTNHLGHFALIGLLMPTLLDSRARVVVVGSIIHGVPRQPADSLPRPEDQQSDLMKYARSKLAVMSLGFELARRFAADGSHASSVVAHPGTAIDSLSPARAVAANQPDVSRALRPVLRAFAHGKHAGATSLVTAVASPAARNGDYWGPQGWRQLRGQPAIHRPNPKALDPGAAARLVTLSEELTGVRLEI